MTDQPKPPKDARERFVEEVTEALNRDYLGLCDAYAEEQPSPCSLEVVDSLVHTNDAQDVEAWERGIDAAVTGYLFHVQGKLKELGRDCSCAEKA